MMSETTSNKEQGLKTCRECGRTKFSSAFEYNRRKCRVCRRKEQTRQKRKTTKVPKYIQKLHRIKCVYKLTKAEYLDMVGAQGNCCLGCGKSVSECGDLQIDHNHNTGKIRGLLCNRCNTLIGLAGDSLTILKKMAEYLDEDE